MPCLEQVEAHDHTGCIFLDLEGNRGLARGCNEYSAQVRVDHPGRFGFYANLPNLKTDLEGSLAEVEYALDSLKADGVCLMTHYDGYYLGHPESVKTFPSIVIRTDGCVPLEASFRYGRSLTGGRRLCSSILPHLKATNRYRHRNTVRVLRSTFAARPLEPRVISRTLLISLLLMRGTFQVSDIVMSGRRQQFHNVNIVLCHGG